jgi:phosphatidylserine/phosphatidylglycerophosphate/cardiolipin synthase-like enzyme
VSYRLYCGSAYRPQLSARLRGRFGDLDAHLRDLMAGAQSRLVILMPYLSRRGVESVRSAIAASAQRGAAIKVVCDPTLDEFVADAMVALMEGAEGALIRGRSRVLRPRCETVGFAHAKLVLADGARGYLGSANLSQRGLSVNFELGIALARQEAADFEALIEAMESRGDLVQVEVGGAR